MTAHPRTARRDACPVAILLILALILGCRDSTSLVPWADDPLQPEGRRIVSLAGTFSTRCALLDSGEMWCWGENRFGEFGDGTRQPSLVPVLAAGGMTFERIFGSQGTSQFCGLAAEGVAYCWGYNLNGELGDGTTTDRLSPVRVAGEHRFEMIAAASHTCGIDLEGQAWCWGSDIGGQLTNDVPGAELVPRAVTHSQPYETLTSGTQFTCALRETGHAECWGWGVGMGSGPGDRTVDEPTPVSGERRYSRLAAGDEWVCALDPNGAPYCWGKAGTSWPEDFRPEPEVVPTQLSFTEIASGAIWGHGSCALTSEGEAHCWSGREAPRVVPGRHRFAGIIGHREGFCGFTPGGSAYCWDWTIERVNGVERWVPGMPTEIPAIPE